VRKCLDTEFYAANGLPATAAGALGSLTVAGTFSFKKKGASFPRKRESTLILRFSTFFNAEQHGFPLSRE
jgi:hypothetical protein